MTLEYQPLDAKRNEIRLIIILPQNPREDDVTAELGTPAPVRCLLQHVSLDDYTAAYTDFMESYASSIPIGARALLWDRITVGDAQLVHMSVSSKHPSFRLLQWAFDSIDQNPKYQDKEKYNARSSRWNWGDFDALSYVWGDPTTTRKIVVNGHYVNVTENLESALQSLRGRVGKRKWQFIWIDALCINQRDIGERNIQVRRMKAIFEEAYTLHAWLGCETEETRLAFKFINKIARMTVASPPKALKYIEAVRTMQHVYDDSTWKGLLDLLRCHYWDRLWIIQELGLANMRATVVWGNQECLLSSWLITTGVLIQDLYDILHNKALKMVDNHRRVEIMKRRKTQFALLIEISRFKFEGLSHPDLMAVLQTGRMAEAFDARDKIYGLLSLMDPTICNLIVPDYKAPALDVYCNFSRTVIKATGRLDMICQCRSNTVYHKDSPSWVVDWSVPPTDVSGFNLSSKIFRAAGDSKHGYEHDGDETHLVCQGLKFDTISGLGCDLLPHTEPPHRVIASAVNSKLANPYKNDSGIKNALWETLMLGQMDQLLPSVAAYLRSLPWFDRTMASNSFNAEFYRRFDSFQQCNRTFEIAGESLKHYFPKRSKDYKVPKGTLGSEIEKALQFIITLIDNKRLMKTKKGFMGLVPKNSQQGDFICVLQGCGAPTVLRPCGNMYKLIGESYIHGIMKGEAMARLQKGTAKLEKIVLC